MTTTMNLQEKQLKNELLYNRHHEGKQLRKYFREQDKDLRKIIEKENIDEDIAIEFVAFMYMVDHANSDMLVGHMKRFFDNNLQATADWINQAIDWDLVDYNGKSFKSCWTIPKILKKEFEAYQYPLPMLVQPRILEKNTDCGYLSIEKESIFCGTTFTTEDACLDVLNKQNSIRLKLNSTIVDLTKNQWKSMNGGRKAEESLEHWQEKVEQFNNYDAKARELVKVFKDMEFWLTNKYDKRGRLYDQGYFIHSQGTDWNKGALEFAHEELVED